MPEKKKKQTMRYSDEELSLMKNTFADNDELLKAIRKVFLQLPLSVVDQAMLLTLRNQTEVLSLLRKTFLPEIDGDAPFHQIVDLWMTVEIKGKTPDEAYLELWARQKLVDYLEQQLAVLGGSTDQNIKFSDCLKQKKGQTKEETYVNMLMRNTLIYHTEQQLNQFSVLAGMKTESVEDTKKRLLQDSSK